MNTRKLWSVFGLGLSLAIAGCSGDEAAAGQGAGVAAGSEAAVPASAPAGNVIEVKMITDGAVNAFVPAEVTARKGDVVRFVLESGVHNVSFAGDPAAAAAGLPGASRFLQSPGESYDVVVNAAPGKYKFQCDPHVPMGMVGTLTVR